MATFPFCLNLPPKFALTPTHTQTNTPMGAGLGQPMQKARPTPCLLWLPPASSRLGGCGGRPVLVGGVGRVLVAQVFGANGDVDCLSVGKKGDQWQHHKRRPRPTPCSTVACWPGGGQRGELCSREKVCWGKWWGKAGYALVSAKKSAQLDAGSNKQCQPLAPTPCCCCWPGLLV